MKVKSFNVGDKVFAKVKGYPAWPAQITSNKGKKYDVKFYGTDEIASLKPEDLFYYKRYKSQFLKTLKRKDYNDAIAQIEAEIEEAGTDGNPNLNDTVNSDLNDSTSEPVKKSAGRKRKLSTSSVDSSHSSKLAKRHSNVAVHEEQRITPVSDIENLTGSEEKQVKVKVEAKPKVRDIENLMGSEEKQVNVKVEAKPKVRDIENLMGSEEKQVKVKVEAKPKVEVVKKDEDSSEVIQTNDNKENFEGGTNRNQIIKRKYSDASNKDNDSAIYENGASEESLDGQVSMNGEAVLRNGQTVLGKSVKMLSLDILYEFEGMALIPDTYLIALISYAEKVREMSDRFKDKSPDGISLDNEIESRVKVLPVKLADGKYVGIKFEPVDYNSFESEYDRALSDEEVAQEVLDLKNELISGKKDSTQQTNIVQELKCDENYLYQMKHQFIIKYKHHKLQWLRKEQILYKSISGIKNALRMEGADTKTAIKLLNRIFDLDIDVLSLKKQSTFLNTMRRLRKYVGNINSWQLSKNGVEKFTIDAEEIRTISGQIYDRFRKLFPYGEDERFTEKFQEECEKFEEDTKDLNESQFLTLFAEPFSRKEVLHRIYDELTPEDDHRLVLDNED